MTNLSSATEGLSPRPDEVLALEPVNPIKAFHDALDGVAVRVAHRISADPKEPGNDQDQRYRIPDAEARLWRLDQDVRHGFPKRRVGISRFRDPETDEIRVGIPVIYARESSAELEVGDNGSVVGIDAAVTGSLRTDDAEYIALQVGALRPGETIATLKGDPERWQVIRTKSEIAYPGQAFLPTKIPGMTLVLTETPNGDWRDQDSRSDSIQVDLKFDKQGLDSIKATEPIPRRDNRYTPLTRTRDTGSASVLE